MNRLIAIVLSLLATSVALTGCAGMRTVNSDVTSYSQWPAERKPASYAFERLPSQQAQPQIAGLARSRRPRRSRRRGFTRPPIRSSADVTVQVGARINRYERSPWDDPFWWRGGLHYWHPYRYGWWGPGYGWWGPGAGLYYSSPRYEREVARADPRPQDRPAAVRSARQQRRPPAATARRLRRCSRPR